MAVVSIPKRITTALLHSIGAGVVARVGLEYIAVGRKEEIAALLRDLENVQEGGAAFRFIVGRFGSGKSFLLQLLRNYAMERGFVVADSDLSPERKLTGAHGQAVATYRELTRNMATKTRPTGGALAAILERWIAGIQSEVLAEGTLHPDDPAFATAVERRILSVAHGLEGLVHGFDFAMVLAAYWRGHRAGDELLKDAALRWLRGEYNTKTDARLALGVRVIVDDDTWYDYIKLWARFVAAIGYKGLIVLIDEAINLYKITHSGSRQANYEKMLAIFNDTMQGKAEHLGVLIGGTPQFVEDPRRGLFSYDALRSRLEESRFLQGGLRDWSGPIIRLQTLTMEEVYVLLTRLENVHKTHFGYERSLSPDELELFLRTVWGRVGAAELVTPRELERDFVTVLNLLQQHPELTLAQVVQSDSFAPTPPVAADDVDEDRDYADFTL